MLESNNPEVVLEGKEVKPTDVPPPTAEELMTKLHELGEQMRDLIVLTKRLPRGKALDPHQDPGRALSMAQMYLQTGFMWLRKAVQMPKEF